VRKELATVPKMEFARMESASVNKDLLGQDVISKNAKITATTEDFALMESANAIKAGAELIAQLDML
jgi:hypothetical protein